MRWYLNALARAGAPDLVECFGGTRSPAPRSVVPTEAELKTLQNCPNPALRWMILAASEAGLRSGAAFGCTLRNCLDGRIAATTKNGKISNVPTSPRILALLQFIPEETPLDTRIVDALEGKPIRQLAHQRRWWEWKQHCGVRQGLRVHDLRRGLARRVYLHSHDLLQVQALLTHASLTSTLWYLDAGQPELEDTTLEKATERGTIQ